MSGISTDLSGTSSAEPSPSEDSAPSSLGLLCTPRADPFSRPEAEPSDVFSRRVCASLSGPGSADISNCGCASGPRLAAFLMTFRFILPVWKMMADRRMIVASRMEGISRDRKWNLLPIKGSPSSITRTTESVCTMALMTVENSFVTKPAAQPCATATTTIIYWYWPQSPNHSLLCDHCSKKSPSMPPDSWRATQRQTEITRQEKSRWNFMM
mmetsp:Transcript_349/g.911  ORF Transcript_349/g.911 Transcript_349/m.911 type:complete len:212 (+) Transcript_349:106-741(+)